MHVGCVVCAAATSGALRWAQPPLRAARFAGSVAVDDPAFGEVVRRHLEIDAIAGENLDAVAPQAARNMRENRLAIFEFDGKGGAREYLLDRPEELEGRLFRGLRGDLSGRCAKRSTASYDRTVLQNIIWS